MSCLYEKAILRVTYYIQRLSHDVALLVHYLEILTHVPNVTGYESLELRTQVDECAFKLRLVLWLYLLLLAIVDDAVDKLLGHGEMVEVIVKFWILSFYLLAMRVHVLKVVV